MPDWVGYRWLIERYGLTVTQPLRVETIIGPTRATLSDGRTELRTVQELLRPEVRVDSALGLPFAARLTTMRWCGRETVVLPVRKNRAGTNPCTRQPNPPRIMERPKPKALRWWIR